VTASNGCGVNVTNTANAQPRASGPVAYDMSGFKMKPGAAKAVHNVGATLHTSPGFKHKTNACTIYVVCVTKLGGNIWHMDADYLDMHNQMFIDQFLKPQGKEIPLFLELLEDMPTCKRGDTKLTQRNKSGYATKKPVFRDVWIRTIIRR